MKRNASLAVLILCAACGSEGNSIGAAGVDAQLSDLEYFEKHAGLTNHLADADVIEAGEFADFSAPDVDAIAAEYNAAMAAPSTRNDALAEDDTIIPSTAEFAEIVDPNDGLLVFRIAHEYDSTHPNASEQQRADYLLEEYTRRKESQQSNALTYIDPGINYNWNALEQNLYKRNPTQGLRVLAVGAYAMQLTPRYWSANTLHNGNGDAFRHCIWNIYMCSAIGCANAKAWADAHEYGAINQPAIEATMDLYNNEIGRRLQLSYGSYADLWAPSATWNGVLRRINSYRIEPTNRTGYKY